MEASKRVEITEARFAQWAAELDAVEGTPIVCIGVSHRPGGQVQAFVPHNDEVEVALMAETLRRLADELETRGPQRREEWDNV